MQLLQRFTFDILREMRRIILRQASFALTSIFAKQLARGDAPSFIPKLGGRKPCKMSLGACRQDYVSAENTCNMPAVSVRRAMREGSIDTLGLQSSRSQYVTSHKAFEQQQARMFRAGCMPHEQLAVYVRCCSQVRHLVKCHGQAAIMQEGEDKLAEITTPKS